MNNIIEIYKSQLIIEQERLLEISEKILPLEQEKARTEQNIKALEQLIGSKEESVKPESIINLAGKPPIEAYKELANDYFKDKSFKDKDIREVANKEGLRVRDEFISGSYSRALLARLLEKDFLEKVGKGLYRYKQSVRKIRFPAKESDS